MFNAEQLLGKMMADMVGSGSGHRKHKRYTGGGLTHSLTSTLLSGKGLITAIGLGVGAYEILKNKQGTPPPITPPPVVPPVSPGGGLAAMPPTPPPMPGAVSENPLRAQKNSGGEDEKLALRLIQVMIAAAHADGGMDSAEEEKILGRLQGQGISSEERSFILAEMHDPKPIEQLTAGVTDPRIAQTMYGLAVSAVVVDTPEERAWLDRLAAALSLSEGMRRFIEGEE